MRLKRILLLPALYLAFLSLAVSVKFFAGTDIVHGVKPHAMPHALHSFELPTMTIALVPQGQRLSTARVGINLEIAPEDAKPLELYTPIIMDGIQNTLQHVSRNQIRARPSLNWLRDDLLYEVNRVSGPVHIFGILFREFVIT
ncbi:MAG: flagellar basal body-associated FliL family protein [Alphaproteobacteria bacterium]|nr:flagellar basal body-associated FliL family protein [Alphaproteobacteria bacterium]